MSAVVYFFRHGQTDWNLQGRIQGKNDVPLNERGRSQAKRLIQPVKSVQIDRILSSDLSRASETAQIIARGLHPEFPQIVLDSRLREADFGMVEGMTKAQIGKWLGAEQGQQMRDLPMPDSLANRLGAETAQRVTARVWESVREFLQKHPSRSLGVSTHGGVIRRVLHSLLDDDRFPPPIPNGAMFGVRVEENWQRFEVLSHLPWNWEEP